MCLIISGGPGGLLLDTGNGPSFLPLPPQVLEEVAQNNTEPGVTTLKLPDTSYHRPADQSIKEIDMELCFVCKKCRMAFPNDQPLLVHQRQCYGPSQESRGAFRIVQTGFECRQCNNGVRYKTLMDLKGHLDSQEHQQIIARPPQSESPLSHEMENVVNQITMLAARAAQERPVELDNNSNAFCQPTEPKRRFLSPTHALTSAGH